jgi:uncharacterized protein YbjT (DUF2867 family)
VVARLVELDHPVRIASRSPGRDHTTKTVDYRTGAGLAEALDGVSAIVHCAGEYRRNDVDRRLIEAARAAGGPHLVYISIVGIDRIPLGYYRVKLAAERLIEQSGLPWSVLRTTQFHDFVPQYWGPLTSLPVVPVPAGARLQPIDVREVATRLVELATTGPSGRVPDIGGPDIEPFKDCVLAYLRARGRRRIVLPIAFPGRIMRGFRAGANLVPDAAVGRITYAQYLAERYPR